MESITGGPAREADLPGATSSENNMGHWAGPWSGRRDAGWACTGPSCGTRFARKGSGVSAGGLSDRSRDPAPGEDLGDGAAVEA